MREYEMETTFDVPLRTFLRLVYGDDGLCLRQYHASCGNCEDANVPAWDVSEDRSTTLHGVLGSRTIAFSKPMELPSVIERLLGPSLGKKNGDSKKPPRASLSFIEKQTLEVEPVTGNVLVRSAASLDTRWVGAEKSDKFNAIVEVAYASIADPTAYGHAERTSMHARIAVNAAGAWALQPVVERVMEHRAVAGFREWVVWIDEFVEKSLHESETNETRLPPLLALGLGDDEETLLGDSNDSGSENSGSKRTVKARVSNLDARNAFTSEDVSHATGGGKKYPATPGVSRRASLSVETESTALVETPPRDESLPSSSEKKHKEPFISDDEERDEARDSNASSSSSDDHDVFDDAASSRSGASFKSAASFRSARSSRSSRSRSSNDARAEEQAMDAIGDGLMSTDPSSRRKGDDDDDDDDAVIATETSPRTPRSARTDVVAEGASKTPSSHSRARLDDAYRDGWFMQTVMNDLTALKTGAGETGRVVAALEERVRALAAEQAKMKSELRRGGASRGGGFGLEHRGDTDAFSRAASGGFGGWARWTAALTLAAGAGYVLAAAARERR